MLFSGTEESENLTALRLVTRRELAEGLSAALTPSTPYIAQPL